VRILRRIGRALDALADMLVALFAWRK